MTRAQEALGIVPLVDFANCSEEPNAVCRSTAEGIELVTKRPLKVDKRDPKSFFQSFFQSFFHMVCLSFWRRARR